jgi:hypothetical protein
MVFTSYVITWRITNEIIGIVRISLKYIKITFFYLNYMFVHL